MSLFSPINPHFFQPLLPGFLKSLWIPVAFFSKYIEGTHETKTITLRSDLLCGTWTVKRDGRRLTGGWEEFAVAHHYRIGDLVVFKHEGEMVFHVTAFGPSFCPLQYEGRTRKGDVATTPNVKRNIKTEESVATKQRVKKKNIKTEEYVATKQKVKKKNMKTEVDSSSNESCFVANVTVSNLQRDAMHLPARFVDRNDLNNRRCKMVLMNEQGRSWSVELRSTITSGRAYMTRGWASFCRGNGQQAGNYFVFKLVSNGTTPTLLGQAGNSRTS